MLRYGRVNACEVRALGSLLRHLVGCIFCLKSRGSFPLLRRRWKLAASSTLLPFTFSQFVSGLEAREQDLTLADAPLGD